MKLARPVRELGTRAPWLHEGGVRGVEIARDGNILTVGADGEARRWMLATGEMAMRTARGPRDGYPYDLFLLPEIERYIASISFDDARFAFRSWDLRTGAYLGEVALADGIPDRSVLAIDRDGRRALLTTNEERAVPGLVSIEDGSLLARLEGGHERGIFLSSGEIVTPDIGGEIRIWDAEGTKFRTLIPPRPPPPDVEERAPMRIQQLFASRTHPLFAVVYDYRVVVFSNDGKELFELVDHYPPIAFSPSGERIALNASGRLVLYDLSGNEQAAVSTDAIPLDSFAIGLDHRVIVGAQSSGELHARSTSTAAPSPGAGSERKATVLPGEIASIATAPAGGDIAFACASGDVMLWEPGQTVAARLPGSGRASANVRYLPDGRLIVSSYYMIRVFSPSTHELSAEFGVLSDNLSPDGRLGASYSSAGRLIVYETETGVVRSDVALEDTSIPPPPQGFQFSSDPAALANDGAFAWLKKNDVRIWGIDGRLRAKSSLDVFVPALPDPPNLYWRSIAFLTNDELLVADSLSGVYILHAGRNEWERLSQEKDTYLSALDPVRRRSALSRKIPDLDEWGVSVFDIDSRTMLLDVPAGGGRHARVEFLADGSLVTATPDRRLVVWEAP